MVELRAAYFVVTLGSRNEDVPSIYWDELPPRNPIRRLVYVQRLDLFPNGEQLCNASLEQLLAAYQMLKKRGKLPPSWEPSKKETKTASVE